MGSFGPDTDLGGSQLIMLEHPKIHLPPGSTCHEALERRAGDFPSFHPKNPLRSRGVSSSQAWPTLSLASLIQTSQEWKFLPRDGEGRREHIPPGKGSGCHRALAAPFAAGVYLLLPAGKGHSWDLFAQNLVRGLWSQLLSASACLESCSRDKS